jgi:hypothetical protein
MTHQRRSVQQLTLNAGRALHTMVPANINTGRDQHTDNSGRLLVSVFPMLDPRSIHFEQID